MKTKLKQINLEIAARYDLIPGYDLISAKINFVQNTIFIVMLKTKHFTFYINRIGLNSHLEYPQIWYLEFATIATVNNSTFFRRHS